MKPRQIILYFLLSVLNVTVAGAFFTTAKTAVPVRGGSIVFVFKNTAYKANVVLTKAASINGYIIQTENEQKNYSIALIVPAVSTAKYMLENEQRQSSMLINNTAYILGDGHVNIIVTGRQLSATFTAKCYAADGKGGYQKNAAADVSGTITNVPIQ